MAGVTFQAAEIRFMKLKFRSVLMCDVDSVY